MKKQKDTLDATPQKRFILSIVSDYDLNKSICELIDNAIDTWFKNNGDKLIVKIDFDLNQKTISIVDNSGGVQESNLEYLISPGASSNLETDNTIGIFGVGTKRAVIALAQDIKITSRYQNDKTYKIEFDDNWLKDPSWELPYFEVDDINPKTTIIELSKLRINIEQTDIDNLIYHLSSVYAKFIKNKSIEIFVNSNTIKPILFENWAYPKGYEPRKYYGEISLKNGRKVKIDVLAGLTTESSPASGEYGVYFYCNNRLIVKALKSPEVGYIKGIAGQPHPSLSIARIIVSIEGASIDMPWNSSKSDINTNHPIFKEIQKWLLEIVKNYTSLSRRLSGDWPGKVFKFKKGKIVSQPVVNFKSSIKSYLLQLPKTRINYGEVVTRSNSKITQKKPWVKGLYESVIVVDNILKQKIETRNRIALILLDSSLEIGFKEFLIYESGTYYSDSQLSQILKTRNTVKNEITKYISNRKISQNDWQRISYYNNLRNKLIHERATVNITDSDIQEFRSLVEKILKKLFKLKFN